MASNGKIRSYKNPYIFFSYAHKNEESLNIIRRFDKEGFRVWWDESINPGSDWIEKIAEHIEACSCFIALITPEYVVSQYCKDELRFAKENEKPLLMIYLEETELSAGMKMAYNGKQAMRKSDYKRDGYFCPEDFFNELFSISAIKQCLKYGYSKKNDAEADTVTESSDSGELTSFEGTVGKIICSQKDFRVFELTTDSGKEKVVGTVGEISEGEKLRITGRKKFIEKYKSYQIEAESCEHVTSEQENAPESVTVEGTVGKIICSQEDFRVFELTTDSGKEKVVGNIGEISEGEKLRITGQKKFIEKYKSYQIEAESCERVTPEQESESVTVEGTVGKIICSQGDFRVFELTTDSGKEKVVGNVGEITEGEKLRVTGIKKFIEKYKNFQIEAEGCERVTSEQESESEAVTVEGTVGKIICSQGDFRVFELTTDSGKEKVVGNVGEISEGEKLRITGRKKFIEKYKSYQIEAESCEHITPEQENTSEAVTFEGTVGKIICSQEDFRVFELTTDSGKEKVVGNVGEISEGEKLRITGQKKFIEKYKSYQIEAESCERVTQEQESAPETVTVEGTVGKIICSQENFRVFELTTDSGKEKVVGNVGEISEGEKLRITGQKKFIEKYKSYQIEAESCERVTQEQESESVTVEGTVGKIICSQKDFRVFELTTDSGKEKVVGNIGEISEGEKLRITGQKKFIEKYKSYQIEAESCERIQMAGNV